MPTLDEVKKFDTPVWDTSVDVSEEGSMEGVLEKAGLNWDVEVRPLFYRGSSDYNYSLIHTVPQCVVVRKDTEDVVGYCKGKYTPVQNTEAFTFLDRLTKNDSVSYARAGYFGKGELVWFQVKLDDTVLRVGKGGEDITEKYITFINGHNAMVRLSFFPSPIRIVCRNTLQAALESAGDYRKTGEGLFLRHLKGIHDEINQAKGQNAVDSVRSYYDNLQEAFSTMSSRLINSAEVNSFLRSIVPGSSVRSVNNRDKILELWDADTNTCYGTRGSLWSLYNAVVEYCDYYRPTPSVDENPSRRLSSAWVGSGSQMKHQAFNQALKVLDN